MTSARRNRQWVVGMGEVIEADSDETLLLQSRPHRRSLRQSLGCAWQISGVYQLLVGFKPWHMSIAENREPPGREAGGQIRRSNDIGDVCLG
jgi:hypothetical protein